MTLVKSGIYADLPVPETWDEVLSSLTPTTALPSARPLPSFGVLVDTYLNLLTPARVQLIWARLGANQTLQQIGDAHGVTRERVRQVNNTVIKTFMREQRLRPILKGFFDGLGRDGALLVDLSGASSTVVPGATPMQLWRFVTQLWSGTSGLLVQMAHVRDNLFVFAPDGLLSEKEVRRVMLESASFLPPTQLALELNCSAADLEVLACISPKLRRTAGGLYGFGGWTVPSLLKAVAEQLALDGVQEWHFSEIGKAAAVFEVDLAKQSARNFAAIVARTDVHFFEQAGRQGYWRLRSLGDGHTDNRAAIQAVLTAYDIPLHTRDISARLQRQVNPSTIYALLDRDPLFRSFGRGVFGISERVYLPAKLEEQAIRAVFAQTGQHTLSVSDVHFYPELAEFELSRLILVGRSSTVFRYWQWGVHTAEFLTVAEEQRRRFARWFASRHERPPPDLGTVQEGLRRAFEVHDRETLRLTSAYFQERGLTLPLETQHWIAWAMG